MATWYPGGETPLLLSREDHQIVTRKCTEICTRVDYIASLIQTNMPCLMSRKALALSTVVSELRQRDNTLPPCRLHSGLQVSDHNENDLALLHQRIR